MKKPKEEKVPLSGKTDGVPTLQGCPNKSNGGWEQTGMQKKGKAEQRGNLQKAKTARDASDRSVFSLKAA